MKTIGILALQGDFERHASTITKLGYRAVEVRTNDELNKTNALIIPGGESSTFLNLFREFKLGDNIVKYAQSKPIMGTCAGLIILSKEANPLTYKPLGLIDIIVERNAYGRQRESFVEDIDLSLNGRHSKYPGVFIRAPKIKRIGEGVKILARHKNEAVLVSADRILAATFHPELTENTDIHQYFINKFMY